MHKEDEELQKGLIITDNISRNPILDFDSYSTALVKMIKNSYPNFTIGIYGEWGTGKSTLMKLIEKNLENDEENIKTVWFDAWKYENEKEFALIPLLKTINYSFKDEKDENKKKLKEALKQATIFTLGISTNIISSVVSNYAGREMGGLLKKSLDEGINKLIPQLKELKELSEIDANSIFYNGIKNIQAALDNLRNLNDFRLVIFVDDLDRVSEEKILEILESIKIFLSLNGIIYILGISHDRVVELINKKYQTNNGEEYLKKFVQIPLTLTEWNEKEVLKLINHLLEKGIIHNDYKPIIEQSKEIIASVIEDNPREIKRFLNNLIISYEVFVRVRQIQKEQEKNTFLKQLLLVQILKSTWKDIYTNIIDSEGQYLSSLQNYIPLSKQNMEALLKNDSVDPELHKLFEKYKYDRRLWNLFDKSNYDILIKIPWDFFRRAREIGREPKKQPSHINSDALMLLKMGRTEEFNRRKNQGEFLEVDLVSADLPFANLREANLSGDNLENANLENANLLRADLSGANLAHARLMKSSLNSVNLDHCNLSHADLKGALLLDANLTNANLIGADLTDSVILDPRNYELLMLNESTNFKDAIIADPKVINYLNKFTNLTPQKLSEKELNSKLEQRGIRR